jgi:hypothetical protein
MPNPSPCYVCDADEPQDYSVNRKRTRLLTWLHYHATNGIEHVGSWRGDPFNGVDAEGKDRLSRTIGWDIKDEHSLMANTRNEYGEISQREFGQIWRLEFDYQGGIYFSSDPQVIFNIGRIYTPYVSKVGVRLRQQAQLMINNAGNSMLTEFLGILEQESTIQADPDYHLLRSGMALYEAIMNDGGYPTWDRPRIWTQVIMLPNMEATKYSTVRAATLLGDMAGCP